MNCVKPYQSENRSSKKYILEDRFFADENANISLICGKHLRSSWRKIYLLYRIKKEIPKHVVSRFLLAGETEVEPATDGFGDRCSTIEPLPYEYVAVLLRK